MPVANRSGGGGIALDLSESVASIEAFTRAIEGPRIRELRMYALHRLDAAGCAEDMAEALNEHGATLRSLLLRSLRPPAGTLDLVSRLRLDTLQELALLRCGLQDPPDTGHLVALTSLDLSGNPLCYGQQPDAWTRTVSGSLETLVLDNTELATVPEAVAHCTTLKVLRLGAERVSVDVLPPNLTALAVSSVRLAASALERVACLETLAVRQIEVQTLLGILDNASRTLKSLDVTCYTGFGSVRLPELELRVVEALAQRPGLVVRLSVPSLDVPVMRCRVPADGVPGEVMAQVEAQVGEAQPRVLETFFVRFQDVLVAGSDGEADADVWCPAPVENASHLCVGTGVRVRVWEDAAPVPGRVRFIGAVPEAGPGVWVGVELRACLVEACAARAASAEVLPLFGGTIAGTTLFPSRMGFAMLAHPCNVTHDPFNMGILTVEDYVSPVARCPMAWRGCTAVFPRHQWSAHLATCPFTETSGASWRFHRGEMTASVHPEARTLTAPALPARWRLPGSLAASCAWQDPGERSAVSVRPTVLPLGQANVVDIVLRSRGTATVHKAKGRWVTGATNNSLVYYTEDALERKLLGVTEAVDPPPAAYTAPCVAAADPDAPCPLELLDGALLTRVLEFLAPADIVAMGDTCRFLRWFVDDPILWRHVHTLSGHGLTTIYDGFVAPRLVGRLAAMDATEPSGLAAVQWPGHDTHDWQVDDVTERFPDDLYGELCAVVDGIRQRLEGGRRRHNARGPRGWFGVHESREPLPELWEGEVAWRVDALGNLGVASGGAVVQWLRLWTESADGLVASRPERYW